MPAHAMGLVGLVLALVASACGYPFPEPFVADRAVYVERVDYEQVEIELPTLATHTTELILAIEPNDVGTGALESVLLAARRHGVPVRAWPLLDDSLGYWPGEGNLEPLRGHVDELRRWNDRNGLGVERIVVTMQPPIAESRMLAAALGRGDLEAATPVLLDNRDPVAFAAAQAEWAEAVDEWHERGLFVDVVAWPHVLDDGGDDDLDLQDMLDSPIDGIAWDEIGVAVWQNFYGDEDARLGPELVRSYGASARERWGDAAVVVLGSVGDANELADTVGYLEPAALRTDASAAASAGLARIQLYSLDGMRDEGGSATWLADLALEPGDVAPNDAVTAARSAIAAIDAM
jgi:hypothetical protein